MPRTQNVSTPACPLHPERVAVEINGVRVNNTHTCAEHSVKRKKEKKESKRTEPERASSGDSDDVWEDVKKTPKKRKSKRASESRHYQVHSPAQAVPVRTIELRIGQLSVTPSPQNTTAPASPAPRPPTSSPQVGSPSKGGFWDYVAKMSQKPLEPVRIGDDVYMMP